MILEGIVTTLDEAGGVNISPMGPIVDASMRHLVLRPFKTSRTYVNLKAHGEGVFHVTDDVWLLARAAVGEVDADTAAAEKVRGRVLIDACRTYEFRISDIQDGDDRTVCHADVVATRRQRDFFGFNRAKHAVVEAAILATRINRLDKTEILAEFTRLAILVDKTGGDQEHKAFDFLRDYVVRTSPPGKTQ